MAKVAVAHGDGIGPEIMDATLRILEAAGAGLDISEVDIGEKLYLQGHETGINPKTWDTILSADAFLKAPITTPQGGGFKSLNVTVRTTLGLYANVRPCVSYAPFIDTKHPCMDVVIVRENEEDLYSGIEYRQTPHVCESIKLISREGSEKICRYAFEYAVRQGRKKVTCFTKDNIMKFSDGLFTKVFQEVAKEYPNIENEHWIVDIGAAKLADTPENFDVIVMPNLYGDILSDVAAQISGSVGLCGSANIGEFGAMFEAIHGSAPRRAGQNLANPSGLIHGAILMLLHLNLPDVATNVHNSWLATIESGIHTYDIFKDGISKKKVGTKEFADAVIAHLGKRPVKLPEKKYQKQEKAKHVTFSDKQISHPRELVGVDVFVYSRDSAEAIRTKFGGKRKAGMDCVYIANRGAKIYPGGMKETFCIEQYRTRFMKEKCSLHDIAVLLKELDGENVDVIKLEHLYLIDGKPGFSNAQDHAK